MALTWGQRRQLTYLAGLACFLGVIGVIFYAIYRPTPSCFDGKQNQGEQGIDCGGPCLLACTEAVIPLKISWVRPLRVSAGWYDVVAEINNTNPDLGARQIAYTFYLYNKDNSLITKRTGQTFVLPKEKFVIFESRVETGAQEIAKAFLELETNLKWERMSEESKDLVIERGVYSAEPRPTLQFWASNTSLQTMSNIQIVGVLSDINNNSLAASATIIDRLLPGQKQELYFNWPEDFSANPVLFDFYWRRVQN